MSTISEGQVEAQNIISLFGNNILNEEISDGADEMFDVEVEENFVMREENIFSNKIASMDVSLETGFIVLADQIAELKLRMKKTSFYLTDLENLLT